MAALLWIAMRTFASKRVAAAISRGASAEKTGERQRSNQSQQHRLTCTAVVLQISMRNIFQRKRSRSTCRAGNCAKRAASLIVLSQGECVPAQEQDTCPDESMASYSTRVLARNSRKEGSYTTTYDAWLHKSIAYDS